MLGTLVVLYSEDVPDLSRRWLSSNADAEAGWQHVKELGDKGNNLSQVRKRKKKKTIESDLKKRYLELLFLLRNRFAVLEVARLWRNDDCDVGRAGDCSAENGRISCCLCWPWWW